MEEKERIERIAAKDCDMEYPVDESKYPPSTVDRYDALVYWITEERKLCESELSAKQSRITELEEEVKDWRDTKYVLAKNAAEWRGNKIKELEEENKRLREAQEYCVIEKNRWTGQRSIFKTHIFSKEEAEKCIKSASTENRTFELMGLILKNI
jgi:chromosome segregation ATPase